MVALTPGSATELDSGSHEQPFADAPSPTSTNSTVGDLTDMEEAGQDAAFGIQPTHFCCSWQILKY